MNTDTTVQFDITGTWERTAVSRHGDSTALMLTIGASSADIPQRAERLPIDLALVLDRSGSMSGDKLELVKGATLEAVDHLGPQDTFSVVMFDTEVQVLMSSVPATAANRDRLATLLRDVQAGATTYLSGGWLAGCELLAERMRAGSTPNLRRAVLLTDGLANVGITEPEQLMTHASALRQRGIITSTMGVGHGFDEVLLGGMAEAGGGNFRYVDSPAELSAFFRNEIGGLLEVIAPQPRLHITFPAGMRGHLVNQFPVDRVGKELTVDLADLRAGDTIPLVFDISVEQGEAGTTFQPVVSIEMPHRRNMSTRISQSVEILTRTRARDVLLHEPRPRVQQLAAQLRADRDHREAMRLDREGRLHEARVVFAQAHATLLAAPASDEMRIEVAEAQRLFDGVGLHDEQTRKDRVHRAMHRSRGGQLSR